MKTVNLRYVAQAFLLCLVVIPFACFNQGVAPDVKVEGGLGALTPFERAKTAVIDGDLAYIKACVESDARYVMAYDERYRTLLHFAAGANQEAIVRYLLEHGARATAEDDDGYYPADIATQERASQTIIDALHEASKLEAGQS